MLGLRNLSKVLVIVGLLSSVNSHAYIISQYESDPNRLNIEQKASQILLIGGVVSLFVAFGVPTPFMWAGAVFFDGDNAPTAKVAPQDHLMNMVSAGVYTASEAKSILSDLNTVTENYGDKIAKLGCNATDKVCKSDFALVAQAFNLRPLTVSYLNNLHGVQN